MTTHPMMRTRLLGSSLALACALLLAACATRPAPTTEAAFAEALPSAVVPGVWSAAAENGTVPDGWLRSFGDPQLEALVGEALKANLDLRAAQAKLDVASAAAMAAGAALQPVVGASGAAQTQGGSADNRLDSRGAGLNMTWELDVWGRLSAESGAAQARYEGAALDLEFARQSIAAATAKAWFIATEARQQELLLQEQVASAQETLRVLEARRAAGKVGEQDVRLASADLAATQASLHAAEAAQQQTVRALEALLGRYPSAELEVSPALPEMPGAVPAGVPSELLQRRPDVAAAERRVRGAFKNVAARQLARLPSLSLTANAGANSQLTEVTSRGGSFFNVGANFFAPIFDGGALKAQVDIATAEQEGALVAYGQTALRAFLDVENSLASEASLAMREERLAAAVQDDQEALRLRKLEADAGKADTLGVLQLQRQVNAARSGLLTLRQARRAERVNLHLALGGGFE
ncbi:MAG: efflux transporter outer membrane subunit [Planctomycetes bacterium]|nr:efflux transporter outer membrane subunit [Planctomycetota bacterium]